METHPVRGERSMGLAEDGGNDEDSDGRALDDEGDHTSEGGILCKRDHEEACRPRLETPQGDESGSSAVVRDAGNARFATVVCEKGNST